MFQNSKQNKSGFMLLEVIVAVALVSIAFTALLGIIFLSLQASSSVKKQTQANALMVEEFEALRNFRDGSQWTSNGLGTVSTGISNPYHMVNNSNTWSLVTGPETSGIFTRQIIFSKVSRDSNQNIESVYNPSHDDLNTVKVTITVAWPQKSMQVMSYFTNWK